MFLKSIIGKSITLNHNLWTLWMISFDTLSTAQGKSSRYPDWKLALLLIVSSHSFIDVPFLWGSSTYKPQINNGGQDSLTIKHFSSSSFDSSPMLAKTKIAS